MDDHWQRLFVGQGVDLIQSRITDVELLAGRVELDAPGAGGDRGLRELERVISRIDPAKRNQPLGILIRDRYDSPFASP
jgi:hypothetical protein